MLLVLASPLPLSLASFEITDSVLRAYFYRISIIVPSLLFPNALAVGMIIRTMIASAFFGGHVPIRYGHGITIRARSGFVNSQAISASSVSPLRTRSIGRAMRCSRAPPTSSNSICSPPDSVGVR